MIAAYRERAQEKEARALFRQMEKLLADPVTSRLVADRGLLDASLLEALERPKIRKALKETGGGTPWQRGLRCQTGTFPT